MGHVPYGYSIENGKAVVDEAAAERVRAFFRAYLTGCSLAEAGAKAGISRCHASLSKMLTDARYIDNAFYPPIIDHNMLDQARAERQHRAEMLGRVSGTKESVPEFPRMRFHMPKIEQVYDDPFMQAEYAYSLIICEVLPDDK